MGTEQLGEQFGDGAVFVTKHLNTQINYRTIYFGVHFPFYLSPINCITTNENIIFVNTSAE